MYWFTGTCFLCIKNNIKVQSVLGQDTDGIIVNEKLKSFFPEIIDSTPDAHKLSCSDCLDKLRISYDFKQSVIRNNAAFRDYIEKLKLQHESHQQLARSKHRTNLPITSDFTAKKVENSGEKHDSNSLIIQNENHNLSSTIQEQVNTQDQSCQRNTEIFNPLIQIEEIYIKQEPLIDDNYNTNYLDNDSKEPEECTATSSDGEYNDQPKQERKEILYKCTDCYKAFTRPSNLERHKRIHSGQKPYQCETCQKTFTQAVHLNTHKLIHTKDKPHQCEVCNKKFNQKSHLMVHKRTHNNIRPYQCELCNKSFTQRYHLTTHMRKHTGETPHECHICDFKCAHASSLTYHIRTHTGEKPYQCKHCNESFITSSYLNVHIKRFHT